MSVQIKDKNAKIILLLCTTQPTSVSHQATTYWCSLASIRPWGAICPSFSLAPIPPWQTIHPVSSCFSLCTEHRSLRKEPLYTSMLDHALYINAGPRTHVRAVKRTKNVANEFYEGSIVEEGSNFFVENIQPITLKAIYKILLPHFRCTKITASSLRYD